MLLEKVKNHEDNHVFFLVVKTATTKKVNNEVQLKINTAKYRLLVDPVNYKPF